jgi:hypothetical protein
MAAARVILVSDSHLSASAPQAQANWDAVVGYVGACRPDGTDHLWVPTTWAVLPGQVQPVLGAKRCGIVSLTLSAAAPAQPELVEPDGLEQLTLTVDLPDPYHD